MPDSEVIALDQWLTSYLDRWKLHERRPDIHLSIGQNATCRVTASAALLGRLLDNLIENALKYSAPGSRVEVSLASDGAGISLSLTDQGCGIGPEDQKAIFEPFFRSRAARNAGIAGTGLGLAIAARIAKALGGHLSCASELGRGSRFTLWLPQAGPGSQDTTRAT
jgi:signal transduction histidine kinase